MEIKRGFRDKLSKHIDINSTFYLTMTIVGQDVYDYSCFGVDSQDKLSDDRYMIFYNQLTSPKGEISYQGDERSAKFAVNLSKLPPSINKLAFTVSIDGQGNMGQVRSFQLTVVQNRNVLLTLNMSGSDFAQEASLVAAEIYKKGEWRLAAVASGFNGGLGDLLRNYGGEEEEEDDPSPALTQAQPYSQASRTTAQAQPYSQASRTTAQAQPYSQANRPTSQAQPYSQANRPTAQAQPYSQANRPTAQAQPYSQASRTTAQAQPYSQANRPTAQAQPYSQANRPTAQAQPYSQASRPTAQAQPYQRILSEATQNLKQVIPHLGLSQSRAKVILALEASLNTANFFANGSMQTLVSKIFPIAELLNPAKELEYWLFGGRSKKMFTIKRDNLAAAIPNDWGSLMWSLGEHKNEITAMADIITSHQPVAMPVLVMFVTSGNPAIDNHLEQMLVNASQLPLFWQFLGIGGTNYGILNRLENIGNLAYNNAKFATISGFSQQSSPELYKFLLSGFSKWIRDIRA
ncbi:MAG: VWA domain-containing protein [Candidatus Bruticola sp.]